jgi:hypothetical protein
MKHKSWIKNYERNFEKLVEEIGDLRYDTLSEFLELLGKKIERDGQKDKSRGRINLANNLQNSAKALKESSESIKEAWRICEPYMFPKDITQKIRTDFKEPNKIREVFKLLSDYYRDWDDDVNFRLVRCMLYESNGEIEKIQENVRIAKTDWRNIIVYVEYDNEMNWLRNFNRPFGEEKITQEDLDNDKYEPLINDDGLPF